LAVEVGCEGGRYHPRVTYRYRIGEVERTGSRLFVWGNPKRELKMEAEGDVRAYLPGAPVEVSYNPADPDEAALEEFRPAGLDWVVAFGCLYVATGATVILSLVPGVPFAHGR
jgi:hypothetical protein